MLRRTQATMRPTDKDIERSNEEPERSEEEIRERLRDLNRRLQMRRQERGLPMLSRPVVIDALDEAEGDVEAAAEIVAKALKKTMEPSLDERYEYAVKDAELAEERERYPLRAIKDGEPGLEWKKINGVNYVKMTTWTGKTAYDKMTPGAAYFVPRDYPIWASIPSEVKKFINDHLTGIEGDDRKKRLVQYFGMPLSAAKKGFVEMWVDPKSMFRPSPDREIDDKIADLTYGSPGVKYRNLPWAEQQHRKWIQERISKSYGAEGYPWTRLGYTYDWGSSTTKQGASEFVIKGLSTVYIDSKTETDDY